MTNQRSRCYHRLHLIETAKLNGILPRAWLTETLASIPDYEINRVDNILSWKTAR
ncbi:transposase domain-containing protein [Sulfitobacter litoralis]|uniref:transposase domain-containing protein n=1 Tax=Sulfitobacter litoralis TaxID=335975 RepID=UPI000B813A1A